MGESKMTKAAMEKTLNALCAHKDTMKCLEANKKVCELEDDHSDHDHSEHDHSEHDEGDMDMNFFELGECLCISCPSLKEGYINFIGTMLETMSATTDPAATTLPPMEQAQAAMKALCPLISGLKCATGKTECASVTKGGLDVTQMGGLDAISAVCPANTGTDTV